MAPLSGSNKSDIFRPQLNVFLENPPADPTHPPHQLGLSYIATFDLQNIMKMVFACKPWSSILGDTGAFLIVPTQ